ncbi:MAG: NUDIX hydrolase, partial [Sulfurimonadaceae bacterium]|nr:NUDIX hydrolase [Sulfurimonadaceae bacterium]
MGEIVQVTPLTEPKFVKPIKINYTQRGIHKEWEAVINHDSVSILLWHVEKKAFVIVKQFRPAILNTNKENGYTYELCAGIIDKDLTDKEIAREEIIEECGYDIPLENIQRVTSFYTSVGISGAKQTLYYAECDESMKLSEGGGIEEENIEVIYLYYKDAKNFIYDET